MAVNRPCLKQIEAPEKGLRRKGRLKQGFPDNRVAEKRTAEMWLAGQQTRLETYG